MMYKKKFLFTKNFVSRVFSTSFDPNTQYIRIKLIFFKFDPYIQCSKKIKEVSKKVEEPLRVGHACGEKWKIHI